MFQPMALTVIFALVAAFVLSLTFVPAMVALLIRGRVEEKENVAGPRRRSASTSRSLRRGAARCAGGRRRRRGVRSPASLLLFARLGQEFVPTLDEQDIAMHAMRIPSTGITQSTADAARGRARSSARFPEVAFVFSKTGTAEMASDPMPPNVSDTFIILKPREEWPDPDEHQGRTLPGADRGGARAGCLGNNYEFTQPIQMRFNELIAGVRSDVAVKVYGDDFEQMQRDARSEIAARAASASRARPT